MDIEEYKSEKCEFCQGKYSCSDIEGNLIDEAVKCCMDMNK